LDLRFVYLTYELLFTKWSSSCLRSQVKVDELITDSTGCENSQVSE